MSDQLLTWVDGDLVDPSSARISPVDHGVTVGNGAFETIALDPSGPFALTRHLDRLERSCTRMGLPLPDRTAVTQGVSAVSGRWPQGTGRLRVTWTGGVGPLSSSRPTGPGTLIIAAMPVPPRPEHARLHRSPFVRNERSALAGVKSTSYAENVIALADAQAHGADEALLANTRGAVCEGTGSNIVVVLDDRAVTPPLSDGPLGGITRELLLEWAREDGLPLTEESVPWSGLGADQGLLLTSSTRNVQLVESLDGMPLHLSPLAQALRECFSRRRHTTPDP